MVESLGDWCTCMTLGRCDGRRDIIGREHQARQQGAKRWQYGLVSWAEMHRNKYVYETQPYSSSEVLPRTNRTTPT